MSEPVGLFPELPMVAVGLCRHGGCSVLLVVAKSYGWFHMRQKDLRD